MNEDFLHRIRVQPPPQFLARLKGKLDRQPARVDSRARLLRSLVAGLLVGASALALASLALRGQFAELHWSGWSRSRVASMSGEVGTNAATTPAQRERALPEGWAQNPWTVASPPAPGRSRKSAASGGSSVVPIAQSASAAPTASVAQYNGRTGLTPASTEHLRIAVSLHAQSYTQAIAQSFVRAGYNEPQLLVEPVDQLLANLCVGGSLDFATVTRRMTPAESAKCTRSGVASMVEVKHGYHAIALVRSKLYGALPLSPRDIYLALSKTIPDPANPAAEAPNRYVTWNEVNPALPPDRIQVLGPALDSEVTQTFVTLVMEAGCNTLPSLAGLQSAAHEEACRTLRDDGVYVAAPEGYPALVQKLQMLPTVVAIVPYSMLELAGDSLVASAIDGVEPSRQSIEKGTYPASRTLYLYVSKDQARRMTSMRAFLLDYLSGVDTDFPVGSFIPLSRAERRNPHQHVHRAGLPTIGEYR